MPRGSDLDRICELVRGAPSEISIDAVPHGFDIAEFGKGLPKQMVPQRHPCGHPSEHARLGATPLSLPTTELYEALQRGLANGVVASWTTFDPFRLGEVTNYHVETRLGTSTGMLFMAKKKFDTLPAEVRKIIQGNSGESSSRQFGAYLDGEVTRISDQVKASESKNKLVSPSDALVTKWQATVEQASEELVEKCAQRKANPSVL